MSRTRLDLYSIYNGALKKAYLLDMINKDIAPIIEKPKHKRKVGTALSLEELNDFIIKIKNTRLELIYMFYLYTGCRRSEALSVKWCDIDYKNNLIHIKGTKTEMSDRYVPLFPKLKEYLIKHKKIDESVFHHRQDFISKTFKKICPQHK